MCKPTRPSVSRFALDSSPASGPTVGNRMKVAQGAAALKISPPLRGEARIWRDLAANALGRV